MKKKVVRLLFLLLFVPFLAFPNGFRDAELKYRDLLHSRKRLYRHNWERVINEYKRLIKKYPDRREKIYYRLYCLYKGLYSYSGFKKDRDRARYYLMKYMREKRRNKPIDFSIQAVKIDWEKVCIRISKFTRFKYFFLEKPSRLVVDIYPSKVKGCGRINILNNELFAALKYAQFNRRTTRLVFYLKGSRNLLIRRSGEKIVIKPRIKKLYFYSSGIRRIVIDPGHGGRDPGAIGPTGLKEKDVVLDIAFMLKDLIRKKTDLKVYLTRRDDRYVPLEKRIKFAKKVRADLFISIHVNASRNRYLRGLEIYYLDPMVNVASIRRLKGTDFIVADLIATSNLRASRELALDIHRGILRSLRKKVRFRSNGIKRGPFYVLLFNNIPSVLIEAGYISNPREENLLRKGYFRRLIAEGIFNGLKDYLTRRLRVVEARAR